MRQIRGQCFGNDRAANTVAANADRRNAGINLEFADAARIEIGERRVHVIGAGGNEVHAIDGDAQAVVGQAVNGRQAGNAASTIKTDAGDITQKLGGVADISALGGYFICVQRAGTVWQRGFTLGGDVDRIHYLRIGLGECRPGESDGHCGHQRMNSIPHETLPFCCI